MLGSSSTTRIFSLSAIVLPREPLATAPIYSVMIIRR
jgi:hypothetical protein